MERKVTFDSISLCTESFGRKTDPAILLMMGRGGSMIWWEAELCQMLARSGHFVIRYDNRDTGKSTVCPPGEPNYTLDDLAEDAIRILDAYSIGKATFVGFSMGGLVGQIAAVRFPERVVKLVLCCTRYKGEGWEELPDTTDNVLRGMRLLEELKPETDEDKVEYLVRRQRVFTSGSTLGFDANRIRSLATLDVEHSGDFLSPRNHSLIPGSSEALNNISQISAPTLVIHGTTDEKIPFAHGERLAKEIPGATLLAMEGMAHELHPQKWNEIFSAVKD